MTDINEDALRNAIRALRESPDPSEFTMRDFTGDSDCRTPGCVLGHYAARPDLQQTFKLDRQLVLRDDEDAWPSYEGPEVCEHFGLTAEQACELFGPTGCDGAESTRDAIAYIERFIERELRQERLDFGMHE